jgi:hypothetical protein
MSLRQQLALAIFSLLVLTGASYRTTNFVVDAPTPELARKIAQTAERQRQQQAKQWLGRELPDWPEPCSIEATVTLGRSGGATSFEFDQGELLTLHMHIEGSIERLLDSVLPHEVTHTIFAHHFGRQPPRWADEGGAVLAEAECIRRRQEFLVRQILHTDRAIPLDRLFALRDYPFDRLSLYAEGFSVASFLVARAGRPTFLAFVTDGMDEGWDEAVRTHYHYRNVQALEHAWHGHLRNRQRWRTFVLVLQIIRLDASGLTLPARATPSVPMARIPERVPTPRQ